MGRRLSDDPWHTPEFLAEKVKDYHKRVREVKADLSGFGGRLNKMEGDQRETQTRVGIMERTLEKIEKKIDSMQTKLAGMFVGVQIITVIVIKFWK